MSQTNPIGTQVPPVPVHQAIARAAQATGVDFNYLLAQARIESSLNPAARAGTSSAAGLYQFTQGTWLATLERHGASHGLDWAGAAIEGGRIADPATRAQVLALRFDPQAAALMAGELASDNRDALSGVLGRAPDASELYMAHFLGEAGASRFLSALRADPGQSAPALFPQAAAANRGIFFDGAGAPRTLGGVMDLMRGKVARAMGQGMDAAPAAWAVQNAAAPAAPLPAGGPIAREFAAAAVSPAPPASRTSMAETLAAAFDVTGQNGGAPGFVRAAYGTLAAFGL